MSDIKMTLQSYARVDGANKDEFRFTIDGYNSKGTSRRVVVVLNDWQINDIIEKVGKIHRQRERDAKYTLEAFMAAVYPKEK